MGRRQGRHAGKNLLYCEAVSDGHVHMNLPEESKSRILMIELIGLSITGLLLFVIACSLQLALRLLSGGALHASRGVLAFGFLFYVCAAFVAAGTRQRPDHPHSLLANLGLRAAFLCVGFLLWRDNIPWSWFAFALGLMLLVHGGAYGFAALRRRALNALLRQPAAIEDTFVERFFLLRPPTYHAIPIGGALGTLFGGMVTRDPAALLCHTIAGVCAALAVAQLPALLANARTLAGTLTQSELGSEPDARAHASKLTLRSVGSPARKELRVFAPAHGSGELAAQVAQVTTALRRVLLVNQLQRAALASLAVVPIWRLDYAQQSPLLLLLVLLGTSLALTLVPYALGQRSR